MLFIFAGYSVCDYDTVSHCHRATCTAFALFAVPACAQSRNKQTSDYVAAVSAGLLTDVMLSAKLIEYFIH